MCQGSEGDEIDTSLGIRYHRVEGDAARGFGFSTTCHNFDCLLGVGRCEVVEHDAVAPFGKSFIKFLEVAHLTFNLEVFSVIFAVLLGTGDGVVNTSAKVDVVVLQQNHVEESDAVVHATTNLHGFLLQHTHARSGLASVEHTSLGACIDECLLILVSHRSDAAHTLEDVEHEAFCLKETLLFTLDGHHNVARLHMGAILYIHFHLHRGVEAAEHFLGYLHASKDAFLLDEKLALAVGIGRDAAERGVVAVANVFCKCEVDESIVEFFYA